MFDLAIICGLVFEKCLHGRIEASLSVSNVCPGCFDKPPTATASRYYNQGLNNSTHRGFAMPRESAPAGASTVEDRVVADMVDGINHEISNDAIKKLKVRK